MINLNIKHYCSLLLLSIFICSCCPEQDTQTVNVELTAVEFSNFSTNSFEEIETTESVYFQDYVISFETTANGPGQTAKPSSSRKLFQSPDCDAPGPDFFINDPIVDISIKPTTDFSANILAGTEMKAHFGTVLISINPSLSPSVRTSTAYIDYDLINTKIVEHHAVEDYLKQSSVFRFGLTPQISPEHSNEMQFTIVLSLQSGKKITGLSQPVKFQLQ
jgi:hypothetical protein